MEEIIQIKNLDILKERRRGLRSALALFYVYVEKVDALNRATISKDVLAAELHVSARTVKNWAKALTDVGAIKYKYSGSARLNPDIYFNGTKENYIKAQEEYKLFRGDL